MGRPKRSIPIDGFKLTEARIGAGYSVDEVATILDLNKSTVSRWERGHLQPSPEDVIRLKLIFRKEFRIVGGQNGK